MRFAKMHGAGNDYVVVDARGLEMDWGEVARRACHRRFGIGADGLLLALPSSVADIRMRMFDPDGTEAEMCGNGIRCLVRFALERGLLAGVGSPVRVETAAGLRTVEPVVEGGRMVRARVGMGPPVLEPELVPVDLAHRVVPLGADLSTAVAFRGGREEYIVPNGLAFDWLLVVEGTALRVTAVSMGNPHAVAFLEDPVEGFPLESLGPLVERHPLFPRRVNLEVVNVRDGKNLAARVWERGVGETMACGTGACAVAVAARLHGYAGGHVDITLPGGVLAVDWDGQGEVFLEGPVAEVFQGEWGET